MLDAAHLALSFTEGRSAKDLADDPMLRLALYHAVQIVGEAAAKVSTEARTQLPELPWAAIVAMRNRLVHGYMDIDDALLWSTATVRLPELIRHVNDVLDAPTC